MTSSSPVTRKLRRALRSALVSSLTYRLSLTVLGIAISRIKYQICQDQKVFRSQVIVSGLFRGMRLSDGYSWSDSDGISKIVGMYEQEILNVIPDLFGLCSVTAVLNVGCADGYYAVGLARMPSVKLVYATDICDAALENTASAALSNGVSDKVVTSRSVRYAEVEAQLGQGEYCLAVIDCEGCEKEIVREFGPSPKMLYIVECHDFMVPEATARVVNALAFSHEVRFICQSGRNPHALSSLAGYHEWARLLAVSEGRPVSMHWVVAIPKELCEADHPSYRAIVAQSSSGLTLPDESPLEFQ